MLVHPDEQPPRCVHFTDLLKVVLVNCKELLLISRDALEGVWATWDKVRYSMNSGWTYQNRRALARASECSSGEGLEAALERRGRRTGFGANATGRHGGTAVVTCLESKEVNTTILRWWNERKDG